MYALRNIFSSLFDKVKQDTEKKPIYTGINRNYTSFDQEVILKTEYLLKNKK